MGLEKCFHVKIMRQIGKKVNQFFVGGQGYCGTTPRVGG
jgi:hypothetical protein